MKSNINISYKIYKSLHEESKSGWIWIYNKDLLENSQNIRFLKIKNNSYNKIIYAEKREIDNNYKEIYNDNKRTKKFELNQEKILIMSYHYRNLLGVKGISDCNDLSVEISNCLWYKLLTLKGHPDPIVKISFWLAVSSIVIGLLGIVLSIVSLAC